MKSSTIAESWTILGGVNTGGELVKWVGSRGAGVLSYKKQTNTHKTYFSIFLHFGIFHRVRVGQKRLRSERVEGGWGVFTVTVLIGKFIYMLCGCRCHTKSDKDKRTIVFCCCFVLR